MEEKNIKKEILWEHLTEKLGRKLNAHETYIFHEIIDLLDTRALTAAPVAEGVEFNPALYNADMDELEFLTEDTTVVSERVNEWVWMNWNF